MIGDRGRCEGIRGFPGLERCADGRAYVRGSRLSTAEVADMVRSGHTLADLLFSAYSTPPSHFEDAMRYEGVTDVRGPRRG